MLIIGEKINGAIPKTADAIRNRDDGYIAHLVEIQEAADYLDVCAGTAPELEYDALCWLIDVVQSRTDKPICIDSPDPRMLEHVFPRIRRPGLLNSISAEGEKCDVLLPLLRDNPDWGVIALCCDNSGIAAAAADKHRIAMQLIERAARFGVAPERMHVDPLVLALSAVNDSAVQFCEALRSIKAACPAVQLTAALSNISYGMPARGLLNRNFLTMSMLSGLDSVIADPSNRDVIGNIRAVEALMGRDRCCRRYNKSFRAGQIGPLKR